MTVASLGLIWAIHLPDGLLTVPWLAGGFVIAGVLALIGSWRVRDEEIPRIVEVHMRRLQSQEHLAHDIADTVQTILEPRGVAVWMGGKHLCMVMRGVEQESSFMETNVLRGEFLEDERTRQEFMSIVNRRGERG